jgi:Zn-finger nucleic acid-binding protein
MHCPVCQIPELNKSRLEEFLTTRTCQSCSGQWLSSHDYWHWLEWHHETPAMKVVSDESLPLADNPRAIFCPDCNHLMRKAKVGHGIDFYLDRCSTCGGVWFDQNEWETLYQRNLHNVVHLIFSDAWQAQLRQEELKKLLEQVYRSSLGDYDYEMALQIKTWIEAHPQKDYIYSLLHQSLSEVAPAVLQDSFSYTQTPQPNTYYPDIPQPHEVQPRVVASSPGFRREGLERHKSAV